MTRPALDSGITRVFPFTLDKVSWLPGYSAPNLIPTQSNEILESGNPEREYAQSFPR